MIKYLILSILGVVTVIDILILWCCFNVCDGKYRKYKFKKGNKQCINNKTGEDNG